MMEPLGTAMGDQIIFDFSDREQTESAGGYYTREHQLSGEGTCVFDHTHPFPASLEGIESDWSKHQYVQLSVYSQEATGHRIDFFIQSDNPATPVVDGYYKEQTVTWQGWKILTFSYGGSGRGTPLGADRITGLTFRFRPLLPVDTTRLFFDRIWLTNDPTPDIMISLDDTQDFIVQSHYDIHNQQEYCGMLRGGHPRLILSADDFLRLKETCKTVPTVKKAYQEVLSQADDILSLPPAGYQKPDGIRLDRTAAHRLLPLALAYKIQGDPRYKERLWQELALICHYPDWNPSHDIDVGDYGRPVALVYDWLYEDFSPEERRTIRNGMMRHAILPMISHFRDKTGFAVDAYNHNTVTSSGIGMTALAMGDEPGYAEICNEVIHETLTAFRLALRHFAPDGACPEGVSYWIYEQRAVCPFIAALISSMGDDFGLKRMPGFSNTGYFIPAMNGEIGKQFNFGDAGEKTEMPPELLFFSKLYGDPVLAAYYLQMEENYSRPRDAVYVLMYADALCREQRCSLPLDHVFHGVMPLATMRSRYGDAEGMFLAFKGGVTHAHGDQDRGSFVLDALGERWVLDLGSESYNVPGMFDASVMGGRWTYYKKRAEGNNTLLIDPLVPQEATTADQNVRARSPITHFVSKKEYAYGIVDLTDAYDRPSEHAKIQHAARGFALINQRKAAILQDEIFGNEAFELYACMHTKASVAIAPDGRSAVMEQNGKQMSVRLYGTSAAVFEVLEAKTLQSKYMDRLNSTPDDVKKLCVHVVGESMVRIAVVFEALPHQQECCMQYKILPMEEWHGYAEDS